MAAESEGRVLTELGLGPFEGGCRDQRLVEKIHKPNEVGQLLEAEIYAGESSEGDLVNDGELSQKLATDVFASNLLRCGFINAAGDTSHHSLDLVGGDRALSTGDPERSADFVGVKGLSSSVPLDDHLADAVDALVGCEADAAMLAGTPTTDLTLLRTGSRVDDAGNAVAAARTLHSD